MNKFLEAYIIAALWSTNDESNEAGGYPLDQTYGIEDLAPKTLAKMEADCTKFQADNKDLLEASKMDDEQAGHDFWLTRCGHGAGYWDRGLEEVGDQLTAACDKWGSVDLYVGDDGRIYC